MTVFSINPYSKAFSYRDKGWLGPIVLPFKEKNPPPVGFTGHAGEYPDTDQVQNWIDEGRHNIGLHLAAVDDDFEVIGIDVDHYVKGDRQKLGWDQLKVLEERLGLLPDTWISTARTDGKSGIRYYLVPKGYSFRGKLDKDIECISKGYRFAVIWPSMHPLGIQYTWFPPGTPLTEDGVNVWDGEIPNAIDLPKLPKAWFEFLTEGGKKLTGAELLKDNNSSVDALQQWVEETFHGYHSDLCQVMAQAVKIHKKKLKDNATSYDVMTTAHAHVIHFAAEGHIGLNKALDEISEAYEKVCNERKKRDGGEEEIRGEIFRSITGAWRKEKAKCDEKEDIGAKPVGVQCDQLGGLCHNNGAALHGVGGGVFTNDTHNGQLRMAYRFADKFGGKLLYVFGIGWHYWDEKRWAFDDRGKAHRFVMATVRAAWEEAINMQPGDERTRLISSIRLCESASGMDGVLKIVSKMKVFAFTVRDLDQDAYLLNVANGTVNLRTLKLKPHDPEDRITKICRAAYNPEVMSPEWENFIKRILPDREVREYLQRLTGISLIGTVLEHILPILTGEGRNGKGTWYEAVLWAMGDYGCIAEPDLFMHREGAHPTGQMELRGSRLVVVSENDKDRRLAEATMKRLTGGDPITARHMRKDFVTFDPSHLAMLITNHLPRVNGDDPAVWARMKVIPFNVVIPKDERDVHLGEKLRLVIDAILTWSLLGLESYHAIGTCEPDAVLDATQKYQSDSDDVAAFIEDECIVGPDAQGNEANITDLHRRWEEWQKDNRCPPMMQRAFGRALESKGHISLPVTKGQRPRSGIALKPKDEVKNRFAQLR